MEKSLVELAEFRAQKCNEIEENLKVIRDHMAEAAIQSGRTPEDVQLMAVTKRVDPYFINFALEQGVTLIGENYVQELLAKKPELHLEQAQLHLIGHLQTNKVKQIITEVDAIQSVDSVKVAKEISKQAQKHDMTAEVLVEINIGEEESKSGADYHAALELCHEISTLPGLYVSGLMAIPPYEEDEKILRGYFAQMHKLFVDIQAENIDNISMNTLSMGMSADYVPAILEGATMVRVGSSIFGARTY